MPIIQQSTVDYIADPAETNALIIDAVETFDNGWVYSEGVADYAVETMQADGLLGNGPDETVGNFDLDRVTELIEKARPVYAALGQEPPPSSRPRTSSPTSSSTTASVSDRSVAHGALAGTLAAP